MIRWMRDNTIVFGGSGSYGGKSAEMERRALAHWHPAQLDDVEIRVWGAHREWHNGHSLCAQRFGQEFLLRYLEVGTITRPLVHHLHEEIGYCLDAPELIPAGSCAGEEFDGQQFPMLTMILREEEQCPKDDTEPVPALHD